LVEIRRLSLCMIVKNEEKNISRCLDSVKHIVDEIIIVDTGSTDRTKEICQSYGVRLYDFQWNGSFADARNYGLERATGDWILWLDADEEVDKEDACKLRDILYLDDYDLISIHLINYYGDHIDKDQVFNIAHHRLFRNDIGFKFFNKIHEALDVLKILPKEEDQKRIGMVPIKVHHYGYMDNQVKEKQKYKRNLEMLEQELNQEDYSPWVHYHIASEHYRAGDYQKAFEQVNASILKFVLEGYTPPALLYKLKYSAMISLGSFEGAWPGIQKAVEMYPDYVDLRFFMGVILYYKERYEEALAAFEQCIELGETNLDYLILKGVGSFHAMYYKGLCYEKLGQIEEAVCMYVDSILISSSFSEVVQALLNVLDKQGIVLDSYLATRYDDPSIRQVTATIESHKAQKAQKNVDLNFES